VGNRVGAAVTRRRRRTRPNDRLGHSTSRDPEGTRRTACASNYLLTRAPSFAAPRSGTTSNAMVSAPSSSTRSRPPSTESAASRNRLHPGRPPRSHTRYSPTHDASLSIRGRLRTASGLCARAGDRTCEASPPVLACPRRTVSIVVKIGWRPATNGSCSGQTALTKQPLCAYVRHGRYAVNGVVRPWV